MSSSYGQIVFAALMCTYFLGVFVGYGLALKHARREQSDHVKRRQEWL